MENMKGSFTLSLAGRDKNRIFIVTDVVNEEYVLIADGMLRKIKKPKKKKLRHLKVFDVKISSEISELTNRSIAKAVKEFNWRDYSAER